MFLLAAIAADCGAPLPARAADACASPAGKVSSVQGTVEVRRSSSADWQQARLDETICAGDVLRVGSRSRAALWLSNETTLRLDQNTTLTVGGPDRDRATLLDLLMGAVHVISRTPHPFGVKTPFLNANIEGTEFLVRTDGGSARVAVYEGRVVAANERGSVSIGAGEQTVAVKDATPLKETLVRPVDAVQWALYFPAISAKAAGGAPPAPSEAKASAAMLIERAGLLLRVGRLDEARPELERAIALDPHAADAYALEAAIAVVEDDKDAAWKLARRAVELDPNSPAARLALSYAQQASFKIEDALASVRKAVELDRTDAVAWARLAELEMSAGNRDSALAAARQAQSLDPGLARTHVVLGFANLVRIDTGAAKAAFAKAIELDPADPLARLGLGLALVREGHLHAGREQIEIAVSLDPGRSLSRSYLGKAYYEEKRDKLAGTQFEMAERLDPKDPTPRLYDAIRKETENRPVEALQDLEQSISLNDNRAVYRSRLLLDEDQAARRVNLAQIYRDLGFDQLALIEAYRSLAEDPASDSAHRFLADAYSDVERGDITRVSESLQAQLRQPTSVPAVDLLLNTDNLFILRDTGPLRLGADEFNQLFDRNRTSAQLDAIWGTQQTVADQVIVSGLADKVGYAVSQLHYGTNGFQDNGDAHKDIFDAFVQGQVTPESTVQLDLKRSRFNVGETFFEFDPALIDPTKLIESSDSARLGGHVDFNARSDLIWSAIYEYRQRTSETLPGAAFPLTIDDTVGTHTVEVQQLLRFDHWHVIAGTGYVDSHDHQNTTQFGEVSNSKSSATNLYAYGHWNPSRYDLGIDLGLAAEFVDFSIDFPGILYLPLKHHRLSPKLGLTWSPIKGTTVRAAAFSAVKRALIGSQTIEPTEVAGFNQFFTGFDHFYGDQQDGSVSERACLAIDQKFSSTSFVGAEITARRLKALFVDPNNNWTEAAWREKSARLYAYEAYGPFSNSSLFSGWQAATALEYSFEQTNRPGTYTLPEGIESLRTDKVPITARFFNARGLTLGVGATYVKQSGIFSGGQGAAEFPNHESGWLSDLFLDYRFPRRLGIVSVGAKNLLDKRIDLFQTDPAFPTLPGRRFVYARIRFTF